MSMSEEEGTAVLRERRKVAFRKKPVYEFFKRAFDLFGSAVLIVLLSWFMLIIALVIVCTSKGGALYVSDRIGKNGKTFRFYKFRSMRVGAEDELEALLSRNETGGLTFKMKDDPRITKFGRFLRKTSLDELPQLFNVFNGSMSFVGPRPGTPREYAKYEEYQKQRLLVKQGITCIWQCSGRSNTTFDEQIEMDLDYVEQRGLWKDFVLLLKTIPAVLLGKGAE